MGKLETNQKQLAKGGAQVSIKCEARLNIPIVRYIVHTSWGMQKTNLVILLDFLILFLYFTYLDVCYYPGLAFKQVPAIQFFRFFLRFNLSACSSMHILFLSIYEVIIG